MSRLIASSSASRRENEPSNRPQMHGVDRTDADLKEDAMPFTTCSSSNSDPQDATLRDEQSVWALLEAARCADVEAIRHAILRAGLDTL